jgi:hypothetical protein
VRIALIVLVALLLPGCATLETIRAREDNLVLKRDYKECRLENGTDTVRKCEENRLALEAANGRYNTLAAAEAAEFQGFSPMDRQLLSGP